MQAIEARARTVYYAPTRRRHYLSKLAGVESLTQVPPERIVNWANRNGLAHYLPTGAVA